MAQQQHAVTFAPTEFELTHQFRLLDFDVVSWEYEDDESSGGSGGGHHKRKDHEFFCIQMTALNELGEKATIFVDDFKPFFFVRVGDNWTQSHVEVFFQYLQREVTPYYTNSLIEATLVKGGELYGFTAGKQFNFVKVVCENMKVFNRATRPWYNIRKNSTGGETKTLKEKGLRYGEGRHAEYLLLYETISPLLRFFHIKNINTTGWIEIDKSCEPAEKQDMTTDVKYEYVVSQDKITPLNDKHTIVPYDICSFDIEASSSHGDFPIPIKTYKKLAVNIHEYYAERCERVAAANAALRSGSGIGGSSGSRLNIGGGGGGSNITSTSSFTQHTFVEDHLENILRKAFGLRLLDSGAEDDKLFIQRAYPIKPVTEDKLPKLMSRLVSLKLKNEQLSKEQRKTSNTIDTIFGKFRDQSFKVSGADDGDCGNDLDEEEGEKDDADEEKEEDECEGEMCDELDENDNDDDNVSLPDEYYLDDAQHQSAACETEEAAAAKNKNEFSFLDILFHSELKPDEKINQITVYLGKVLPKLEGDKCTFIGSTFVKYGQKEPYLQVCIALDTCDNLITNVGETEGIATQSIVETYKTEAEVLVAWTRLIKRINPDIIIGYNIFNFDEEFLFQRSKECGVMEEFLQLSRNKGELCAKYISSRDEYDIERKSTTLASGTYELSMINMKGRIQIDLLNWFRRTENLSSYKLDYVSGFYIGDDIKKVQHSVEIDADTGEEIAVSRLYTSNMSGLHVENYIHIHEITHSTNVYKNNAKFMVRSINPAEKYFTIRGHETPQGKINRWGLAKDDLTPQDIFRMTNEGAQSRGIVAKYCIQDCNLVQYLFNKNDIMTDIIEVSSVSNVPMAYRVNRGLGILLTSVVSKECFAKGVYMKTLPKSLGCESYEGAYVLEPKTGIYMDEPISVNDFNSLYPSSMLSENLCPSSKVRTWEYDMWDNLLRETGYQDPKTKKYVFDGLPEYKYVDIKFDTYKFTQRPGVKKADKQRTGYKICRFAQYPNHINKGMAIIPGVLDMLLEKRKSTRKEQKNYGKSDFMYRILEKRQLGFKLLANSIYGQLGAQSSTFYEPDIAASTTATGRKLITYSKRVIEECYGLKPSEGVPNEVSSGVTRHTTYGTLVPTSKHGNVYCKAVCVYGDTDSLFYNLVITSAETCERIYGTDALEISIELAQQIGDVIGDFLKQPHNFEYEKTFLPFCLLSKKRYIGMLYGDNIEHCYRKEMGCELKRRDNAPIVKDFYGGVIDIIMSRQSVEKAVEFVETNLDKLCRGDVEMDKLIISKSLRSYYAKIRPAHKVLADRIGEREPGNKPGAGDRVPYVFVVPSPELIKAKGGEKKLLQGDKIELPSYVVDHGLQIDYAHYMTNQIQKPIAGLLGLVLDELWRNRGMEHKIPIHAQAIAAIRRETVDDDDKKRDKKVRDKIAKLMGNEVKALIFDKYLRTVTNKRMGNKEITSFFKAAPKKTASASNAPDSKISTGMLKDSGIKQQKIVLW